MLCPTSQCSVDQKLTFGALSNEHKLLALRTSLIAWFDCLWGRKQQWHSRTSAHHAPSVTGDGSVSVGKNTSLVLDVSATDPDGDTLIFTLTGEDAGLFDITEDGQLNFATAPDFEAPSDADGDNVYSLTVSVSDGTSDTSLDVVAEVINDEDDDFQLTASAFATGTVIPLINACQH